ncbi:PEP-CTERM sorting domain-containing protein [Parasalinivibrio latis]|uniref:PEP-CTERM sorting domain-containing protein n=1 Tax=Parasalinivibrio latis TaxID=2952610 RepID=UPI0030E5C6E8
MVRLICLVFSLLAAISFSSHAAIITSDSEDVIKSGNPHAFLYNPTGTSQAHDANSNGQFRYDTEAGTASYSATFYNPNDATSGFSLDLNLKEIPFSSLGLSDPRCEANDCGGSYYTSNGISPKDDWSFFKVDTSLTNVVQGFGSYASLSPVISGEKWFQFGDGAGGTRVVATGYALAGWFKFDSGNGDLNVNLTNLSVVSPDTSIPEPATLALFGTALLLFGRRTLCKKS